MTITKKYIIRISISIAVCLLIATLSGFATKSSVYTWYATLNKPSFTPPNWLFAPVWTILYIMMGIAAGIVWTRGFYHKWVKTALYHFGFQLLLNGMWSIVFFGFNKPFWALLISIALIVLVSLTIKWFKVVNDIAAYLLIPYLLWICFATVLNFSIWQLN
jgi:tryptophan-rich sensory protein